MMGGEEEGEGLLSVWPFFCFFLREAVVAAAVAAALGGNEEEGEEEEGNSGVHRTCIYVRGDATVSATHDSRQTHVQLQNRQAPHHPLTSTHLAPHPAAVEGLEAVPRRQEGLTGAPQLLPPPLLPLALLAIAFVFLLPCLGQIHHHPPLPVPVTA